MKVDSGPHEENRLVDVRAVARRLGVSTRCIWKWTSAARVPRPVRIGRVVRWPLASLEAWISAGCPPVADWKVGGDNARPVEQQRGPRPQLHTRVRRRLGHRPASPAQNAEETR